MLGIYSLIWTICHKLMWFSRNTVLFHIIFVVMLGEIFGHLGHTGPLTVKTKWRCRRCIGGDCVVFLLLLKEIRLQLSHKASQQVLLQHVSHTAETDKVLLVLWSWWVKISGHSEQLGPCGSTSHFVNNRHSKVKTRGASCIGGFGQTDGRRKFELGIPQSRGAPYIRGASYIRDKTVLIHAIINYIGAWIIN